MAQECYQKEKRVQSGGASDEHPAQVTLRLHAQFPMGAAFRFQHYVEAVSLQEFSYFFPFTVSKHLVYSPSNCSAWSSVPPLALPP